MINCSEDEKRFIEKDLELSLKRAIAGGRVFNKFSVSTPTGAKHRHLHRSFIWSFRF